MLHKLSNRLIENIHVGLWLIKDMCWMLESKLLGCIMIAPTILAALFIIYKSQKDTELWVNLAVFCWILANSTWMLVEFFQLKTKLYSLPFFILGILFFIIYLFKFSQNKD